MGVEGGVEQTLGRRLVVGSSKGQTKVEGGRGAAVRRWSRGKDLVDRYLVEWKDQQMIVPH